MTTGGYDLSRFQIKFLGVLKDLLELAFDDWKGENNCPIFRDVCNQACVDLTLIWNTDLANADKAIREMRANRSGIWSVAYMQAKFGVGKSEPTRTALYHGVGKEGLCSTVLQHSLVYDLICHHHHLKARNGKDWNECLLTQAEKVAQYNGNIGKRLWSNLAGEEIVLEE